MLALRRSDINRIENYARICKAQSKGRLNEQTKVAKVRDALLNERALHALAIMRPHSEAAGSCIFRSARYDADFETERAVRDMFNKALKALGVRHRKPYNTRHTYATMLLMAGVNINWVASQLGNSPLMVATVYAKWIHGQADQEEMAKLNTRVALDNAPTIASSMVQCEREIIGKLQRAARKKRAVMRRKKTELAENWRRP
jgi:integrase